MCADALDLVGVAAEARLVGDLGELGKIVGEPTFLVGRPRRTGRRRIAREERVRGRRGPGPWYLWRD